MNSVTKKNRPYKNWDSAYPTVLSLSLNSDQSPHIFSFHLGVDRLPIEFALCLQHNLSIDFYGGNFVRERNPLWLCQVRLPHKGRRHHRNVDLKYLSMFTTWHTRKLWTSDDESVVCAFCDRPEMYETYVLYTHT